jgi:hypothetical protein
MMPVSLNQYCQFHNTLHHNNITAKGKISIEKSH